MSCTCPHTVGFFLVARVLSVTAETMLQAQITCLKGISLLILLQLDFTLTCFCTFLRVSLFFVFTVSDRQTRDRGRVGEERRHVGW